MKILFSLFLSFFTISIFAQTKCINPTLVLGISQTITLPVSTATVTASAIANNGGSITSFVWSEVSGPNSAGMVTMSSSTNSNLNLSKLIAGLYTFQLKATDNCGTSTTGSVSITVNSAVVVNQPPVVKAGSNQTITLPVNSVTLTGNVTIGNSAIASTLWTVVSGPNNPSINIPSALSTSVTGMIAGTYVFNLKAIDNNGLSSNATVSVIVNPAIIVSQPPVVNIGFSSASATITITASASSPSGNTIVRYGWGKISGPGTQRLTNASSKSATISGLVQGTYQFKVTVWDNKGLVSSATIVFIMP